MTFLSLQKVSEAVAINTLPFYLTGAAESWFFSLDNSLKTSLESIRQAIHNRSKPSSRHNLQLMDVKQKDTESVEDFIHRVTSLTNDRAVDQDWLITVIINGLKEDLSMEVIKADPQTLEDVRNIASRAEMAGRRRTTTPALQESTNLALLNALQEIRDDVQESCNPQQQPRRPFYQKGHQQRPRSHHGGYQPSAPRFQPPVHGPPQPPRHPRPAPQHQRYSHPRGEFCDSDKNNISFSRCYYYIKVGHFKRECPQKLANQQTFQTNSSNMSSHYDYSQ